MTIEEYSESRIGETWTEDDHLRLCFTMQEVTRLAQQAHDYQANPITPANLACRLEQEQQRG